MSRTAAAFMAETLQQAGVRRVYGVVGDSLNGFTDALRAMGTIDWVHMRHEEGAAFAAGAEAHVTGANGFLDTGVELTNPNFAKMAESMGIKGIRVERPQELRGALNSAFEHDGPVLVDVVSARQELAMPPKTTFEEAYHFGMFLMKAVLDGRGAELIDLAKVNLRR